MSFAFGFGGDDIESDGDAADLVKNIEQCDINGPQELLQPKRHSLPELLSALPSQLSCNFLGVSSRTSDAGVSGPNGSSSHEVVYIPRRSVFDIRTQLMAEANPEENDNDNLLAGLERGDLSSGIYEGGFKTWECAVDLAGLVSNISLNRNLHVVELGAGSAIPSLVLLQRALQQNSNNSQQAHLRLTLCDYNEDVLRLATAPNVFLAQQAQSFESENTTAGSEYEVEDIDEAMTNSTIEALDQCSVAFDFISGAWGDDFLKLLSARGDTIPDDEEMLILASETIYSPTSTKDFADTTIHLLRSGPSRSRAWVAAKQVYFGVGGGVEDFKQEVVRRGAQVKTLLEVKDAGVARIVLEVTIHD